MANIKISELAELSAPASDDVLPITDTSASATKKITFANLVTNAMNAAITALGLGTAATLDAPASGNAAAGELVKGGDTRLSDARAPLAHTQAVSTVTGLQAALDDKAPLASPAFSGTPTAPTAANATSSTQIASTAFVHAVLTELIGTAPANLDTLQEIAEQLADDEAALAALITTVSGKLTKSANLSDLTNAAQARTNLELGNVNNTSDAAKPVSTATQAAIDVEATARASADTALDTRVTALEAGGSGERLLTGDGATINLNSATAQTIYTVPVGKRLIGVTKGYLRDPSVAFEDGSTDVVALTGSLSFPGITGMITGQVNYLVVAGGLRLALSAGQTITATPNVAFGQTCTATIDLFGYLIDA